ncbi:hypothetical protein [Microbulbifer hydrolyticus]|uniref:Uncharacterized protein n=1 Tax=Microbulbifer hydrolyticus TaxID=48074 RepID=A0A6P1T7E0_9GAMM|nr:hypothetical protein [Microbulbifer hydrolyticus]MBB5213112.1 hypothetical protein [Microbulbifer hydrolyticus]QHQ38678.1 hypothetical protein GTQ55_06530 [Microbulbifer hydrolyticus]
MEHFISAISFFLIAFLTPLLTKKLNGKKYENIEKRIFRDLGDRIEITTSLGTWPFGPKSLRVKKGSVAIIQEDAVISLFLKNKGVIDLFFGGINSEEIAQEAAKVFPEAEIVKIPRH